MLTPLWPCCARRVAGIGHPSEFATTALQSGLRCTFSRWFQDGSLSRGLQNRVHAAEGIELGAPLSAPRAQFRTRNHSDAL